MDAAKLKSFRLSYGCHNFVAGCELMETAHATASASGHTTATPLLVPQPERANEDARASQAEQSQTPASPSRKSMKEAWKDLSYFLVLSS